LKQRGRDFKLASLQIERIEGLKIENLDFQK